MKKALLIVISMLVLTHSITSQTGKVPAKPATKDATVEQLKKLDIEVGDSFLKGDTKALAGLLADEMVMLSAEGDVIATKPDILEQMEQRSGAPMPTVKVDKVEVFVFGPTAIVSSKLTMTMVVNGKARSMPSSGVNTYSLDNGRWRLVSSQMPPEPSEQQPYVPQDVRFDLAIDPALMKGSKDATVVMIEYVDYQCPLCRKFAAETMGRIQTDYVTPGKLGVIARHLPLENLHPLAFGAATAAECAKEQGKFWEMDERLLRGTSSLAPADLKVHASSLDLDADKFDRCVDDEKTKAAIMGDKAEAAKLGITGTPYFLIGVRKPGSAEVKAVRMIKGAFPYDVFKGALDSVITAQGR